MSEKLDQLSSLFELTSESDIKSLEFLMKALEKSNQEGFDYIEFKQSYAALIKLPMDKPLAMMCWVLQTNHPEGKSSVWFCAKKSERGQSWWKKSRTAKTSISDRPK